MCLVIFCFITGITRGVSWDCDRNFRWSHDSSNWTVNLRSSTVEECEDVMSRLKKEHTENEWSMILKSLSSESTGVIFKSLNMSAVRKLNISNTPLDSKHVSTLSEILSDNKTMIDLQLTNCNITDNGVRYICEGLTKNQTLTELDISDNPQVTSASTSTIAELINTTKSLRYLRVKNISFTDDDLKTICTSLHSNTTIQTLMLSEQHYEYCKKLDSYQFIKDRLSC